MSKDLIEIINLRFSKFVVINDGCWSWTGRSMKDGRGLVWINGKNETAPRIMWFLVTGAFPEKPLFVCHHCDNPECCNPSHLFIGTVRDNAIDAARKGRLFLQKHPQENYYAKNPYQRARGSRHGSAKLKEADVIEIRKCRKSGIASTKELAEKYSVSTDLINKIARGAKWKHI